MSRGFIDLGNESNYLNAVISFPNNSFIIKGYRLEADTTVSTGFHLITFLLVTGGSMTHPVSSTSVSYSSYDLYDAHFNGSVGYTDNANGSVGTSGGTSGPSLGGVGFTPAVDGEKVVVFPDGGIRCPAGAIMHVTGYGLTHANGSNFSPAYWCNWVLDVEVI